MYIEIRQGCLMMLRIFVMCNHPKTKHRNASDATISVKKTICQAGTMVVCSKFPTT
ncbi:hypothetical protein SCLCIDRAFT_1117695 [Scleroderma citrinum Foug A]|uniref:Uncharacterized protein n=1 Tax=Scleroderma citrinum Foug A TaxID=1036808 RepID=A0A0C2ZZF6_9AGAM|nr:hypothetical protein SCLCIDRAFT_1117695 [Scleroderma citrinum Foug A]